MDKKELAELIARVEAMQQQVLSFSRDLAKLAIRLRFLPISQSSNDSDDGMEDAPVSTPRGM